MNLYINNPITTEDYLNNIQFQLDNIEGYISIKSYESALIKAKCLVQDLNELIEKDKK